MIVQPAPVQAPECSAQTDPARDPADSPASPGPYYTPTSIDRWLREWPLLESLAETPRSSRHYLTWEHKHRRCACQDDPKVEQRGTGYFGDELSYADIKADLELAWIHLRGGQRWSPEFLIVEQRMLGKNIREIALVYQRSVATVHKRYWEAVEAMAWRLGWTGEGGDPD